jgi:hypothetical protein
MDLDKIAVEENEDLDNIESEEELELELEPKAHEVHRVQAFLQKGSAHEVHELEPANPQQMQTAPAQLLPADANTRREIIFKIKRYYARFPHLRDDLPLDLNTLDDIPDLERTLDEIRLIMSNKKVASIPQIMAATGLAAIEGLSVYTPLKLQGLSKLSQNQEFIDLVDEWAIENGSYRYIPASQRLLYMVAMTSLQLHCINTEKEMLEAAKKAQSVDQLAPGDNEATPERRQTSEPKAHEVHRIKKLQDLDSRLL